MEKEVEHLRAANAEIKEKASEQDRYKRKWNLRIRWMKEKMNEDTRNDVIHLLVKIAPHWEKNMEVRFIGSAGRRRTGHDISSFNLQDASTGMRFGR